MKRVVLAAIGLAMMPVASAFAAEGCGVYTLETRPPGEKVARIVDDRELTIEEQGETPLTYELRSAGSGIPYQEGHPTSPADGEIVEVLEHKGDLIVDSMPYVPFCKP